MGEISRRKKPKKKKRTHFCNFPIKLCISWRKIQNYTKTKTTQLALENLLDDCLCPLDEPNQKLGKDNMCAVFVQLNN